MPVTAEQLPALLSKSLAPVYLVAGAEPLLVQESRDFIIRSAQDQGFAERTVYDVAKNFDWDLLNEDASALSLFASRKIVDVRLPTGRPGNDGSRVLIEMAEASDPDILLLVTCAQWDSSLKKSKWVSVLARAGVLVEIWPVKPQQLPKWIRGRMTAAGLKPDAEAIAMLADLVEGNLLAAQQEIDKLLLLEKGGRVTAADIAQSVANSSRFDAFRLVDCVLQGQLGDSLRVASGLQRTGVAIQPVCGALYRELTLADTFRASLQSGQSESSMFSKLRIWPARQAPIQQAASRLTEYDFGESFRALSLIDLQSKGRADGDPWQTLDRLLWRLCEPRHAATGIL